MTNNQLPTPTPPKSLAAPTPVPALPKTPTPTSASRPVSPLPVAPAPRPQSAPQPQPVSQTPQPQPVAQPPIQPPRPPAPQPQVAQSQVPQAPKLATPVPTPRPVPQTTPVSQSQPLAQHPPAPMPPAPRPPAPPAIPHLPPRPPVPQSALGRQGSAPLPAGSNRVMSSPQPLPTQAPPQPPPSNPPGNLSSNRNTSPMPPITPAATPKVAKISKSPLRFLPFILGGLALLSLIVFLAIRFLGGSTRTPVANDPGVDGPRNVAPVQQTTLTYWGLWEPTDVMNQIFADFEDANPGISVNYVKQSHLDYRERLQSTISQGTGPDVFRFHASWTPMLRDELSAIPNSIYSNSSFASTFYPVASQQLQYNGQLRGIPLMYDGLALYYNEDILKAANAEVPKTWADLRILATQLTVKSAGSVERAGLAIGNASNVEHFSDILALLLLQNGADLSDPTSSQAQDALQFYTDFYTEYEVWSDALPNSTVAFARGDVAMMFAPSWRAHEILAQNPDLKFGIAPVPKLGNSQVSWASYWAEGVNSKSKNKDAAWKLLSYMSSAEVLKKMYGQQSNVRRFGELYSRQDLANDLRSEPFAVPFLSDAPSAQGWYMSSYTHDNGINDQIIKYYEDAINSVVSGGNPSKALETVATGINQVLRQYGVATTVSKSAPTNVRQ